MIAVLVMLLLLPATIKGHDGTACDILRLCLIGLLTAAIFDSFIADLELDFIGFVFLYTHRKYRCNAIRSCDDIA